MLFDKVIGEFEITINVVYCQLLMEHLMGFTDNALKELTASLMKVMRTFYLKF